MPRITTPAERVIRKCGNDDLFKGLTLVSGWCGLNITAVRRWTYSKDQTGGSGGVIPTKYWPVVIARAALCNLELDPAEFYFTADELAPRLAAAAPGSTFPTEAAA